MNEDTRLSVQKYEPQSNCQVHRNVQLELERTGGHEARLRTQAAKDTWTKGSVQGADGSSGLALGSVPSCGSPLRREDRDTLVPLDASGTLNVLHRSDPEPRGSVKRESMVGRSALRSGQTEQRGLRLGLAMVTQPLSVGGYWVLCFGFL